VLQANVSPSNDSKIPPSSNALSFARCLFNQAAKFHSMGIFVSMNHELNAVQITCHLHLSVLPLHGLATYGHFISLHGVAWRAENQPSGGLASGEPERRLTRAEDA
jgi:hypothetical protein